MDEDVGETLSVLAPLGAVVESRKRSRTTFDASLGTIAPAAVGTHQPVRVQTVVNASVRAPGDAVRLGSLDDLGSKLLSDAFRPVADAACTRLRRGVVIWRDRDVASTTTIPTGPAERGVALHGLAATLTRAQSDAYAASCAGIRRRVRRSTEHNAVPSTSEQFKEAVIGRSPLGRRRAMSMTTHTCAHTHTHKGAAQAQTRARVEALPVACLAELHCLWCTYAVTWLRGVLAQTSEAAAGVAVHTHTHTHTHTRTRGAAERKESQPVRRAAVMGDLAAAEARGTGGARGQDAARVKLRVRVCWSAATAGLRDGDAAGHDVGRLGGGVMTKEQASVACRSRVSLGAASGSGASVPACVCVRLTGAYVRVAANHGSDEAGPEGYVLQETQNVMFLQVAPGTRVRQVVKRPGTLLHVCVPLTLIDAAATTLAWPPAWTQIASSTASFILDAGDRRNSS